MNSQNRRKRAISDCTSMRSAIQVLLYETSELVSFVSLRKGKWGAKVSWLMML